MSGPTRISIDRLRLRVRGMPVETAQATADGLGADLAARLAAAGLGSADLRQVHIGPLEAGPQATAAELRSAVAGEVSAAIARRTTGEPG